MQLPPPVHGAALMNNYVKHSKVLQNNFHVDVLSLQYVNSTSQLKKISIKKLFLFIKYSVALFWKLLNDRPDLVYFTLSPIGLAFIRDSMMVAIIKMFGIKRVYHLHGMGIKKYYDKYRRLYDYVFNNVQVICLANNVVSDISFFKGIPYILNNGITPINTTEVLNKGKKKNGNIRILFLSNFIKSKGVLELIKACKILKERELKFEVHLVGQFRDELPKETLQKYIQSYNLTEQVVLVGPIFGNLKNEYWNNADIFVHPTYNDCFPLVIIEAMQHSIPVISTFEGGIPEIVENNVSGILVKQKDYISLAEKIEYLIRNKQIRISMGQKGAQLYKEKFTVAKFEHNLNNILLKIVESSNLT